MNLSTWPTPIAVREEWRTSAACGGMTTLDRDDIFFPDGRGAFGPGRDPWAKARTICGGCPVAVECLEAEMRHEGDAPLRVRHGMRGGLTPEERLALHRAAVAA